MAAGYRVKFIRCESGERLPLLLNKKTGIPLWDPTLFILTELRATNRAAATLAQATRSIMVLYQALEYLQIDLNQRLSQCKLLEIGEIDLLVKLVGLTQTELDLILDKSKTTEKGPFRIVSLTRSRMYNSVSKPLQVDARTKAIRMVYIREYIEWLAAGQLLKLDTTHQRHQTLMTTSQIVVERLNARIPVSEQRTDVCPRQGINKEVRARILEVIDPQSAKNPWKNNHVRRRNQLIFLWLLLLGVRNGELLSLHVDDVNFRAGEVNIVRRADDPVEFRKNAPNVKTYGRLLALGTTLTDLTRAYVMNYRASIKGARRHPYLFVATGSGNPLTKSALQKLFIALRTKIPELPNDLSPHMLRHTWNDDFSELMDARGVSPDDEQRMRNQAMGWSDHSKMAVHYTRRHVQRRSNEASLALQAKSFNLMTKKLS